MKTVLHILVVFGCCAFAGAQSKTEVIVNKGLVKTTTARGDSIVKPGQKAVLVDGKEPALSFNNRIVEKLLWMDKQIEAERAEGKLKMDHTLAYYMAIESENTWKFGAIMALANKSDKPETVLKLGPTSAVDNVDFYTMEGVAIPYKKERLDATHDLFYLQFSEAVQPGKDFKAIAIKDLNDKMPEFAQMKEQVLTREDGLWKLWTANDTPNCLNYMYFVLPKSAQFVKSEPQAQTIEEADGRLAVFIRKYSGSEAQSRFTAYFNWPEKK